MKRDIDPTAQFPYLLPLQWHMDLSNFRLTGKPSLTYSCRCLRR